MDYSSFNRSPNVEDDRLKSAPTLFNALFGPTSSVDWDTRNQQFQRQIPFYEQLYLPTNPSLARLRPTGLGRQLGFTDVDNMVRALRNGPQ